MRFAICDDEPEHIEILKAYFNARPELSIESEPYFSGTSLVEDYRKNSVRYDALFIDMEMPGLNGIDTANAIREMDKRAIIVFVTSHTKYMQESFQCRPLDFLVKPVEKAALDRVIAAIVKTVSEERVSITFTENKRIVSLYCDEIIFCESEGHWINIHTATEIYRTRMTMAALEEKLAPGLFARAAKGYFVNLDQVRTIDGYDLHLRDTDRVLSLSRTYAKSFKQALTVRNARRLCL